MTTLPGEAILQRRGLYMLPTRHGWMFAVVLAVLLIAAINYGNSLAYGLTFLLAAVAVVSMLYTDRNLLHLRVRAGSCAPVFAGEVAVFRVHLVNDAARPRFGVALIRGREEIARADVSAAGTATLELRAAAPRRGWLLLPAFHINTRFPLGILYSWSRRVALDARCLVYPQPSEPWAWRTQSDTELAANARPAAGGDDFSGVREYRPGDSPRQIDWKSAARGRGLLTKEFAAGLSETLWFDLARVPAPDVETRLSMICRAVLDAEHAGLQYGLRLGATAIEPDGGEAHEQRCLRALALHGVGDER
jgi:uncharacterized protein (DUF58 family)